MIRAALVALILAGCGSAPRGGAAGVVEPTAATTGADADLEKRMLARLRQAAQCGGGSSEFGYWCIAAEGFEKAEAGDIPEGDHAWVGLSLALIEEGDDESNLMDNVLLAAFGARNQGGKVRAVITDIDPPGAEERLMVTAAKDAVAKVLRGQATVARIPKPLHDFVTSIPADAPHLLVRKGRDWVLEGAARAHLRRVGDAWVALERPTKGPAGIFVSIFVPVGLE